MCDDAGGGTVGAHAGEIVLIPGKERDIFGEERIFVAHAGNLDNQIRLEGGDLFEVRILKGLIVGLQGDAHLAAAIGFHRGFELSHGMLQDGGVAGGDAQDAEGFGGGGEDAREAAGIHRACEGFFEAAAPVIAGHAGVVFFDGAAEIVAAYFVACLEVFHGGIKFNTGAAAQGAADDAAGEGQQRILLEIVTEIREHLFAGGGDVPAGPRVRDEGFEIMEVEEHGQGEGIGLENVECAGVGGERVAGGLSDVEGEPAHAQAVEGDGAGGGAFFAIEVPDSFEGLVIEEFPAGSTGSGAVDCGAFLNIENLIIAIGGLMELEIGQLGGGLGDEPCAGGGAFLEFTKIGGETAGAAGPGDESGGGDAGRGFGLEEAIRGGGQFQGGEGFAVILGGHGVVGIAGVGGQRRRRRRRRDRGPRW